MNLMPFPSKENLRILILWWIVGAALLLWAQWRSKRAAGLPLVYGFVLTLNHLAGAAIYAVESYQPRSEILLQSGYSLLNTYTGFFVSFVGFWSFVIGCLVCPFFFTKEPARLMKRPVHQITTDLPGTLLLFSLLIFFLMRPLLTRIPGFSAVASAGTYISVAALTLMIFQAYQAKDRARFFKWFSATFAFPIVTLSLMGFAGYGAVAAAMTWAFALRFIRPRWLYCLVFGFLMYFGITVYVNYMRERESIRDSVWAGRSLSARFDKITKIFTNFEWFDGHTQRQLETVDVRLNQNELVGKAVLYIESGRVQIAEGGTLAAAALAWIPRILWPNKPATGGSGSIVSRYTGIKFAEGTSVGVGQVMEFYINWKLTSVIIGFLIYGLTITWMDQRAGSYWAQGDLWNTVRWISPGLGMMQAGGSMTEVVSSVAGAFVFVWGLHHFIFGKYYEDSFGPRPQVMYHGSGQMRGSRVDRAPPMRR